MIVEDGKTNKFHYWGEMITYLGMTMPMAIWSTITWLKNPATNGKADAEKILYLFLAVYKISKFTEYTIIVDRI